MPRVTLPDGNVRTYDAPLTVAEVAADIAVSLAKNTLAAEVNGKQVDTSFLIENDVAIKLITTKDPEAVEIIRHSTAHLMAQAVKAIFPSVQITIGPVIEDGYYYDFSYERPFTEDELGKIEQKMRELSKAKLPVERSVMPRDEAIEFFKAQGEHYKAEIIADIPEGEHISLYRQGDFIDLCRGPHVPHTGFLKVFKIMKVAGAYWRGDANNAMLQRIYGTAWLSKEDQDAYLFRIEEAKKRDHRKIGKQMDLFHQEESAPGMVFWHEKGWTIFQVIEQYIRRKQKAAGYLEIKTPQVLDAALWEKSGHSAKYSDNMFLTSSEKREYAIKPMSCPCHVLTYNQGLKSYRDLPMRFAEFGVCHRNESSGSLHGLMRVRSMTQDDGHVFCTPAQMNQEIQAFMNFALPIYKDFGLTDIEIKLALRPENKIGDDALWDQAEAALSNALTEMGLAFVTLPGEGAFYGPKIELHLRDSIGRQWQCGTLQLDFFMPERLGAEYVTESNEKATPIMLHRAALGTLDRFIGILIEHYAGKLPLWLAPQQVAMIPISEKHNEYALKCQKSLEQLGFRVHSDLRNEKIGFKIRENTLQNVPYLFIVGDQEVESGKMAVRVRSGEDLGALSVEEAASLLNEASTLQCAV